MQEALVLAPGLDHHSCAAELMVVLIGCRLLSLMLLGGEEVGAWPALTVGQLYVVDVLVGSGCSRRCCRVLLESYRVGPSGPRDATAIGLLFR